MPHQTHYVTLDIDENASPDMIQFAYNRLLKEAKDKLQDSPLFFEKEQNLKHAYQVLSQPALRQAYNNKLAKERTVKANNNEPSYTNSDYFNPMEYIGGVLLSKTFLGAVFSIIILIVIIPSGGERVAKDVLTQQIDFEEKYRNQQIEMEHRREDRLVLNQEHNEYIDTRKLDYSDASEQRRLEMERRRLDMQETREEAKIAREERRLVMQEEREMRETEYELERKAKREKEEEKYKQRREEYEAQRRSNEAVARIKRTGEMQRDIERLKAGY